jgi:KDO2-lipid IV(A) lauroyltransferase
VTSPGDGGGSPPGSPPPHEAGSGAAEPAAGSGATPRARPARATPAAGAREDGAPRLTLGGRLVYALIRASSALLGALPEALVAWLAAAAGGLWFHALRYRRAVILENLARAFPELPAAERRRLGREACQHLVAALLELLRTPRYFARGVERVVTSRGLEEVHRALEKGRGLLIVTGHLGSFELSAGAIVRAVAPLRAHLLVKSFPPGVDAFLTARRAAAGYHIIRDRRTLPEILRALRNNEIVVFVIDQNATRNQGVFVDFFGEQACTMAALAVVARRTGAPVHGVSIWREGPGRHVVEVHAELTPATETDSDEVLMQRYTRFVEDCIRAHPAQWTWTHRRWRTRPR